MADALQAVQKALKEAGFTSRYEKSNGLPRILVVFDGLTLEIARASDAQVALGEEVSEKIDYVQCFAILPFSITHRAAVAELMAYLNAIIPLVGFCLMRDPLKAAFRYLLIVENQHIAHAALVEAVDTIRFLLKTFSPIVAMVANGERTVAEALAEMQ